MDIQALLTSLTLEEKCSLLSGANFWYTKAVDRLGIPKVYLSDGPHGLRLQDEAGDHLGLLDSIPAVCFPAASASAASFDPDLTRQIGEGVGQACRNRNVSVILGPAVNIKRSPLCGRNFEYFSEDPFLAGEMAVGLINGVQSKHIGTSIKHFAANSQEHRRMSSDSVVDERTLREIYFPAFETAVKRAKPWTVMCSYNRINGIYASDNHWLLTEVLRDEWGFDGYVVSDWGAVNDRVAGVKAGMDLEMPGPSDANDRRVLEAVKSGELEEADVDRVLTRILTVMNRYLDARDGDNSWDMEAQHDLARKLSAECMVLLKNEDAVLPLKAGESIAVIGKFAVEPRYQGGGSSHINSFKVTSLMDALEGVPGITYAQGYDIISEEPDEAMIAEAVQAAKQAKAAVIVAGLPAAFESEGYDRSHMAMPRCQNALIKAVAAANPNTVVVLYNGSPVEMPWADDVKGIIEAYLGGQAVGGATKDILFGDANPCGRLPETFPYQLEDNPSYLTYGGEGDTAVYNEGVFVGYRYYDKKKMAVRWPFGYGLSYTTFEYSNLTVSADAIQDTDALTVCVDITNTGKAAGKEVVQLYVRNAPCSVFRPVRELKGIAKVLLQPGETQTVTFTLDKRAFAYWNTEAHDWIVESGTFGIEIARSSRDIALARDVAVEGTSKFRKRVTLNTIMLDVMSDPVAVQTLKPILDAMVAALSGGKKPQDAPEDDGMMKAMMGYMPIRALAGFSRGALSIETVEQLCAAINRANGLE